MFVRSQHIAAHAAVVVAGADIHLGSLGHVPEKGDFEKFDYFEIAVHLG